MQKEIAFGILGECFKKVSTFELSLTLLEVGPVKKKRGDRKNQDDYTKIPAGKRWAL